MLIIILNFPDNITLRLTKALTIAMRHAASLVGIGIHRLAIPKIIQLGRVW